MSWKKTFRCLILFPDTRKVRTILEYPTEKRKKYKINNYI